MDDITPGHAMDGSAPIDAGHELDASASEPCVAAPEPFSSCTTEDQACDGPPACRPCGPGLWAVIAQWTCFCSNATWQCALLPACMEDWPGTFVDDACTTPSQQTDDAGND